MLLVVLRPADREPVGGDAERAARDRQDEDQGAQAQPFAPARASSTSVAWVTPVAPRAAKGVVFRK
jgi:hypothetical protein